VRAELEARSRVLADTQRFRRLIDTLSHDIRTPLTRSALALLEPYLTSNTALHALGRSSATRCI
jgi:K+-sensing histidine kinase KdpD